MKLALRLPDADDALAFTEPAATLIQRYGQAVQRCRDRLGREARTLGLDPLLSSFLSSGKMLRAHLVFVSGTLVGADTERLLEGAVALELLHAASLIHDDIVDSGRQRRNMPALHLQTGVPSALLVGDLLIVRAFSVLAAGAAQGSAQDSATMLHAIRSLGHHAARCCVGALDELDTAKSAWSPEHYVAIAEAKTGGQFAAATVLGAALGGATPKVLRALRRYGVSTGIAFQIRDDLLDLRTTPKQSVNPLRGETARSWALTAQHGYVSAAKLALAGLPASAEREALGALAAYSVARHQ